MSEKEFDLIIAGGGIAGLTSGLGSARAGLKTLVMTGDVLGGQLLSIERIDGDPGFPKGGRGHGGSPCATCDAPLLRGRVVGVVGGGDSALQEALTLAEFASRVVIFHRGKGLSAQAAYRERVTKHPKIEIRLSTGVEEGLGDRPP